MKLTIPLIQLHGANSSYTVKHIKVVPQCEKNIYIGFQNI